MYNHLNMIWNDFQDNVSKTFSSLRKEQDFYDIALLSDDGEAVSAHKVVLSASFCPLNDVRFFTIILYPVHQ